MLSSSLLKVVLILPSPTLTLTLVQEHWLRKGFRSDAFAQDDVGYITHIIPPKEVPLTETAVEFLSIDVNKTQALTGVGSTGHLFLQGSDKC